MSESDLPIDPAITIQAETSLVDPDSCKFTVSRTVHPGGPFFFDDPKRARGSPLVERLFALPGVAYVLIAGNVVTVGKEPGASWSGLRPAIGTGLRTQLLTGIPAILEATASAGTPERTDAESRAVVQQLLDREVNRSIAAHGGQISIVDIRDELHRHERRVPGMLGIKGDPAPGVRGDAAPGSRRRSRISLTRRTTQRGIRRSTAAQGRAGIDQDGRASGYVNPCGVPEACPACELQRCACGVPEALRWPRPGAIGAAWLLGMMTGRVVASALPDFRAACWLACLSASFAGVQGCGTARAVARGRGAAPHLAGARWDCARRAVWAARSGSCREGCGRRLVTPGTVCGGTVAWSPGSGPIRAARDARSERGVRCRAVIGVQGGSRSKRKAGRGPRAVTARRWLM